MLKVHITPEVREGIVEALGDASLADWWIEEYKKRAELQLAEALEEMLEVSKENFNAQHRPQDGLGQCTFRMGPKLAHWLHVYAPGYVYDEAFLKQLVADNPHLCFKPTYQRKASIIRPEFQAA